VSRVGPNWTPEMVLEKMRAPTDWSLTMYGRATKAFGAGAAIWLQEIRLATKEAGRRHEFGGCHVYDSQLKAMADALNRSRMPSAMWAKLEAAP
jgi:hypothetical protein